MTRIGIHDRFGESGTASALIEKYGLDGKGIYASVRDFVKA
jgi:transketolase